MAISGRQLRGRLARSAGCTAAVLLGAGLVLAGCSSDDDKDAKTAQIVLNPCPHVGLLAAAADLVVYGEGALAGPESVAYSLELVDTEAACAAAEGDKVTAEVAVSVYVRRGPAGRDLSVIEVPLIVALVRRSDQTLIERVPVTAAVKLGTDQDGGEVAYASLSVPLAGAAPADYQLVVALQLTPAELATALRHRQGR